MMYLELNFKYYSLFNGSNITLKKSKPKNQTNHFEESYITIFRLVVHKNLMNHFIYALVITTTYSSLIMNAITFLSTSIGIDTIYIYTSIDILCIF